MTRAQREPWYDELPVTEDVMNYDHWKTTEPDLDAHREPPDEDDWFNEEAAALIEPHLSGRGYVVRDNGDGYVREPDYLHGTRVARFDRWSDAYVAALAALGIPGES